MVTRLTACTEIYEWLRVQIQRVVQPQCNVGMNGHSLKESPKRRRCSIMSSIQPSQMVRISRIDYVFDHSVLIYEVALRVLDASPHWRAQRRLLRLPGSRIH